MTGLSLDSFRIAYLTGALIVATSLPGFAQGADAASSLQERYAAIRLQYLEENDQEGLLEDLLEEAEAYRDRNPGSAAAWIASARIRLAYASTQGLGGLSMLKTVRDELEQAILLDKRAQEGFAPIFLGFLYAAYPRRPISIGNKKRATELAEEAMAIDSTNKANNYYYALYLATRNETDRAREYLLKAREAREIGSETPMMEKFLKRQIDLALQEIGK